MYKKMKTVQLYCTNRKRSLLKKKKQGYYTLDLKPKKPYFFEKIMLRVKKLCRDKKKKNLIVKKRKETMKNAVLRTKRGKETKELEKNCSLSRGPKSLPRTSRPNKSLKSVSCWAIYSPMLVSTGSSTSSIMWTTPLAREWSSPTNQSSLPGCR